MSITTQPPQNGPAETHQVIKKPSRAPLFVLAGIGLFALVFIAATWESWTPTREVEVVRVLSIKSTAQHSEQADSQASPSSKSAIFQAAGWIEADPQPIAVTALVSGIVEHVSVLDGQAVKKGQEIARLDDTDFRIALAIAQAEHQEAKARVKQAQRQLEIAETHVATHDKHHALAEAKIAQRKDEADRLAQLENTVSEREQKQAALALQTAQAQLEAVHTQLAIHQASVKEKQAQLEIMQARLAISQEKVNKAKLDLDRCIIRATHDGSIKELFASPGRKQMLGSDNIHSTTVATLYDPASLQVRVDVPLDDSAGLFIGQTASISCNALPRKIFQGTVTRILGVADLSRNTLQAKVKIENPDQLLRPDMLVKVQFHGKANNSTSSQQSGMLQLILPKKYFPNYQDIQQVWVVGKDDRLERKSVSFAAYQDAYVSANEGLAAGMWVVINPQSDLQVGERVHSKEVNHE